MLTKDLDACIADTTDPELRRVYEIAKENVVESVDSVVISPQLELLSHINVHEVAPYGERSYLDYLRQAISNR